MPVSRKGRVQVDSGIREQEYATYKAQNIVHVGPQRKESQAANFQRLASDLSQFNSALGKFASGVGAAADRAEKRAEKLKKEQEAAARREERKKAAAARSASYKKRRSGGGGGGGSRTSKKLSRAEQRRAEYEERHTIANPSGTEEKAISGDPGTSKRILGEENAAVQTITELNDIKKGETGRILKEELGQQLAQDKANRGRVPIEDEHGEPMRDADGKPMTRVKTVAEIQMEGYKMQKRTDQLYGGNKVARTHIKGEIAKATLKRIELAKQYETQDRRIQTEKHIASSTTQLAAELQNEGFDPDEVQKMVMADAMAKARLTYPDMSEDEVLGLVIEGDYKALDSENVEIARALMHKYQGSPDRKNGVTELPKHPKWGKDSHKVLRKATKVWLKHKGETEKQLQVANYISALNNGEPATPITPISRVVNGERINITVDEIMREVGAQIDSKELIVDGVEIPEEERPRAQGKLLQRYADLGAVESPELKRVGDNLVISGDGIINQNTPGMEEFVKLSNQAYTLGRDEGLAWERHLSPGKRQIARFVHALRRNGVTSEDEVYKRLNVFLRHRRSGERPLTLGHKIENKLATVEWEGITREQRQQIMDVGRALVIDRGLEYDEVLKVMEDQRDQFKVYNPQFNGVTITIPPELNYRPDKFQEDAQMEVELMRGRHPEHRNKDVYLEREGNGFIYYDKATKAPLLSNTNPPYPLGMTFADLQALAKKREVADTSNYLAGNAKSLPKAHKESKTGGNMGVWRRWATGKDLDEEYREKMAAEKARTDAEEPEIEKIISERGDQRYNEPSAYMPNATSDRGM